MKFAVLDHCPAPRSVAPYIYLVLRQAGQTASSIYRGEDAKALLHANGKRTQAEIHRDLPAISNPPGRSQHECRSDGNANPGPVGRHLEEWEVGIDSGGDSAQQKAQVESAARHFGWQARHPYSRGVEGHHWCFARKPQARGVRQRAQVLAASAAIGIGPPPLAPIKLGSRGPRVAQLKRRLVKLGYATAVTWGKFGAFMVDALKKFQRDHGLTPDGVCGPATQRAIKAALRRKKG